MAKHFVIAVAFYPLLLALHVRASSAYIIIHGGCRTLLEGLYSAVQFHLLRSTVAWLVRSMLTTVLAFQLSPYLPDFSVVDRSTRLPLTAGQRCAGWSGNQHDLRDSGRTTGCSPRWYQRWPGRTEAGGTMLSRGLFIPRFLRFRFAQGRRTFSPAWGAGHSWMHYSLLRGSASTLYGDMTFEVHVYHGVGIAASTVFAL